MHPRQFLSVSRAENVLSFYLSFFLSFFIYCITPSRGLHAGGLRPIATVQLYKSKNLSFMKSVDEKIIFVDIYVLCRN